MNKELITAYHDSESLKKAFVAQVVTARENRVFAKSAFKSKRASTKDFISWLAPSAKRSAAPQVVSERLGIPEELLLLSTAIYQRINKSQFVAERFLGSIQTGSDLSGCSAKILNWILVETDSSLLSYCKKKGSKNLIKECAELFDSKKDVDKKAAQRIESACRERALSRKFRKKYVLPNGVRADLDLLRPEFVALWGAARAAAWQARKVKSAHWVLMAVDAWFRASKESFLEKNQKKEEFRTMNIREYFDLEVAPALAEALFDQLLKSIKEAAQAADASVN